MDDGQNTIVTINAFTNYRVPPTQEFCHFLATNNTYFFGALNAFEREDGANVRLSHTLLGDFLDPEELKVAVALLAGTADSIDTQIQQKFGGDVFHSD